MLQLGDICLLQGAEVEPVDLIIGGSPCQNISISGNGTGLGGIESRLFFEQMRVIREMREAGGFPRYMVWENVANIFSCNSGNDFRRVLFRNGVNRRRKGGEGVRPEGRSEERLEEGGRAVRRKLVDRMEAHERKVLRRSAEQAPHSGGRRL